MRRSQAVALASRPYAYAALEFLANVSRVSAGFIPPLLEKRPVKKTAIVMVASDKGLTGSFNSAVFRAFEKHFGSSVSENSSVSCVAVGQKAVSYLGKRIGMVEKGFTKFGDVTTVEEARPLAEYLIDGYLTKEWDRVLVFYTNFRSALHQDVVIRELFPITFEKLKETAEEIIPKHGKFAEEGYRPVFDEISGRSEKEYIIEPSPEDVLTRLVPHLVVMQVYHIILEANASEHAARRLAMKNASDNARDIADVLALEYNKSRQAGITRELTEITAGAEVVNI